MMTISLGDAWAHAVVSLGVEPGAAAVAGPGAPEVAVALQAAGWPAAGFEEPELALLGGGLAGEAVDITGLESNSLGLVVLRKAWADRPGMVAALRQAFRVLRPGGAAVAAVPDAEEMLGSSGNRYPERVAYSLVPSAAETLLRSSIRTLIAYEFPRAGFREVVSFMIEEHHGSYPAVEDYVAARAAAWESPGTGGAGSVADRAATELRKISPFGPIVDRRPWFAIAGEKPQP
jgi:SAM-dependent methyltransferase